MVGALLGELDQSGLEVEDVILKLGAKVDAALQADLKIEDKHPDDASYNGLLSNFIALTNATLDIPYQTDLEV